MAVEPTAFRGATISAHEIGALRSIENVVRAGKVLGIGARGVGLQEADIPTDGDQLHVDCTAAGVRATVPRSVFEPGRITIQYVTIGIVPWGSVQMIRRSQLRSWRWPELSGPPWRTWPEGAACRAPLCPNPDFRHRQAHAGSDGSTPSSRRSAAMSRSCWYVSSKRVWKNICTGADRHGTGRSPIVPVANTSHSRSRGVGC